MRRAITLMFVLLTVLLIAPGCGSGTGSGADDQQKIKQGMADYDALETYWNNMMTMRRDFGVRYDASAREAEKEEAALNGEMIGCYLYGRCYLDSVRDLSQLAAPPNRLADAHRALVAAWRKSGRTLIRSSKQLKKAEANPDIAYTLYGEGRRIVDRAGDAAVQAENRGNKAWKKWIAAAERERGRLESELTALGVTFTESTPQ